MDIFDLKIGESVFLNNDCHITVVGIQDDAVSLACDLTSNISVRPAGMTNLAIGSSYYSDSIEY